ncbi:MAG: ClbS/DfsB family four-helix bundle protein [Dehalococcoidia bacterium]|nr:ClbS/DfsB family four-helix bundle protein [Dehalococcoidia bacterium]
MSKQAVLDELDQAYTELDQELSSLDEQAGNKAWFGEWNVKQILAHVSGWHREMTSSLERVARGERPTPEGVDYSDSDGWNARFAAELTAPSLGEARAQLETTHQGFRKALEGVDEDRFAEGKTAYRIAYATGTNHYREHGDAIRKWRAG